MNMDVTEYLDKNFPGLQLIPSIYKQWPIGIHFLLGEGIYQFDEKGKLHLKRFEKAYQQAWTIFNELFDQEDDLILVTNVYLQKQQQIQKVKVYQPNLRDKNNLNKLNVETHPYPFDRDEKEGYEMQRFSLHCQAKDVRVEHILKAAINEDFPPLKPRFARNGADYPDVFFVNATRDIILFIYDDRGCEVIANKADKLQPLYQKYAHWVDDFEKEQIAKNLGLPPDNDFSKS